MRHLSTVPRRFFMSGSIRSRSPIWVLDWDGTITRKDTLDALVNISASHRPQSSIHKKWAQLGRSYMEDFDKTIKSCTPSNPSIAQEKKLLVVLEDVELRSLDRVSKSAIFAELTDKIIDDGASEAIQKGNVQLRNGFLKLYQSLNPSRFHILSVNWSQRFIAACLEAAKLTTISEILPVIHSNELDGISQGTPSTGIIGPSYQNQHRIVSSRNKLAKLEALRQNSTSMVYIGDSWTDFECLLAADLGICIRDEPMTGTQKKLAEALERVGVVCMRLGTNAEGVVWARDFEEVNRWFDGV